MCEILEAVGISTEGVHNILPDYLVKEKLSAWLLTHDHEQNRVLISKECLARFKRNPNQVFAPFRNRGRHMDPSQHTRHQGTFKTVDFSWRIEGEEAQDGSAWQVAHDDSILGCTFNTLKRVKGSTFNIFQSFWTDWTLIWSTNFRKKCSFFSFFKFMIWDTYYLLSIFSRLSPVRLFVVSKPKEVARLQDI